MSGENEHATARAAEGAVPLAAQELREQLEDLAHNANSALNGVSDAVGLTEKVEKNPYGMVAAALGIGYVLGGGLFTPTTMRLLRMGSKLAALPPVRDKLLDLAEAAVDGLVSKMQQPEGEPAEPTGSRKE
jgi:ElaB/YqjD/DUF883 family membrane-anchored ribosome-binding protein